MIVAIMLLACLQACSSRKSLVAAVVGNVYVQLYGRAVKTNCMLFLSNFTRLLCMECNHDMDTYVPPNNHISLANLPCKVLSYLHRNVQSCTHASQKTAVQYATS